MGKYKIEVKASAIKELYLLPKKDLKKIAARIGSLSDNPRPKDCIKLAGDERHRIRQGDYRIVYSIENDALVVYVVTIGHRKDA